MLLVKAVGHRRCSCGSAGRATAVAAETGVLMASPSETTLIVLGSATAAQLISRDTAAFWQIVTAIGLTVTPLLAKLGRAAGSRFAGRAMANQMDAGRSRQRRWARS